MSNTQIVMILIAIGAVTIGAFFCVGLLVILSAAPRPQTEPIVKPSLPTSTHIVPEVPVVPAVPRVIDTPTATAVFMPTASPKPTATSTPSPSAQVAQAGGKDCTFSWEQPSGAALYECPLNAGMAIFGEQTLFDSMILDFKSLVERAWTANPALPGVKVIYSADFVDKYGQTINAPAFEMYMAKALYDKVNMDNLTLAKIAKLVVDEKETGSYIFVPSMTYRIKFAAYLAASD